jgi:hypothetical protein
LYYAQKNNAVIGFIQNYAGGSDENFFAMFGIVNWEERMLQGLTITQDYAETFSWYKNAVIPGYQGVGTFGGKCQCGDGSVYDFALPEGIECSDTEQQKIYCYQGEVTSCPVTPQFLPPLIGQKVLCGWENFKIPNDGVNGSSCECPNGDVLEFSIPSSQSCTEKADYCINGEVPSGAACGS